MKTIEINDRDRQMLDLLAQGASNGSIADSLGYREGTMRVYLHGLYKKLGVGNKTSAVIWYSDVCRLFSGKVAEADRWANLPAKTAAERIGKSNSQARDACERLALERPLFEVVVVVEGWSKVRDANGDLTWVESRQLADRRTVLIKAPLAPIRDAADDAAPVVFQAQQNVVLELIEVAGPWLRVRHRDGQAGYLRVTQAWGA